VTGGSPATGPLWHERRFATYWAGQTVSQFGDRISELALPLIAVATLAASPTQVGLLTAAVWAPNVVSLFVGSWVDQQQHKRRLLIAVDLLRAAVLLSLPIAHVLGVVTLAQLFTVALLTGFGQVLFQTSYQPFFVALVRRDQYIEANSLLSGTRSASFIAGPAVGGGLIQALTAPVAVLVDALSFVVSAVLLRRVRVAERVVARSDDPSLLRRARDGMRFVVGDPYLKASLGCATTINFFNFMASALLILFASRELGLSAGVIGLAFGLGGVGGIVGAVLASRVSRAIGVGRAIVLGGIVFSAPIALVPLAHVPTLAKAAVLVAAEFIAATGVMCFDINLNALPASVVPDALRSRVTGAFSTVNYGIRPLGAVAGGVLAEIIGTGPTLVVAAVGGSLAFVWLLPSPIPGVRTIAELEPAAR
jgi:predicted MFS family arabinose efflux permease